MHFSKGTTTSLIASTARSTTVALIMQLAVLAVVDSSTASSSGGAGALDDDHRHDIITTATTTKNNRNKYNDSSDTNNNHYLSAMIVDGRGAGSNIVQNDARREDYPSHDQDHTSRGGGDNEKKNNINNNPRSAAAVVPVDAGILSSSSLSSNRLRHQLLLLQSDQQEERHLPPLVSKDSRSVRSSTATISRRARLQGTTACTDGYVDCNNGNLASDATTTCAAACVDANENYLCCAGTDACTGLTSKVCMDGISCMGENACKDANLPQGVVNSCNGDYSCYIAGGVIPETNGSSGTVGKMIDSCNGGNACRELAANGGTVGDIESSCNGERSCESLGRLVGSVGDITSSCIEDDACKYAGQEGTVGNIENSCTDVLSCYGLSVISVENGSAGGTVGNIVSSCTAAKACQMAGRNNGSVGDIENSCTSDYSCTYIGSNGGDVGNLDNSCKGFSACKNAGSNLGSVGGITGSCNAANACEEAGISEESLVTSNMNNCCNSDEECKAVSEETLPAECSTSVPPPPPPPSPTTSPTPSPTLYPTIFPTTSGTTTPTLPNNLALTFVGPCPAQISDSTIVYYEPGDRVTRDTVVFECKSWPSSLFCSQVAFNPDLDSKLEVWKQAWEVIGYCKGNIDGGTLDGCPAKWSSGDTSKYKENDQVSVVKSSSPLVQVVYKCKPWPYSLYCGQLSPLNYNGGILGWDYVGQCSGTISPTVSPTLSPATVIIDGCPSEFNSSPAKEYVAGDEVAVALDGDHPSSSLKNVYVCREFPLSGYCNQAGFAPGEQYDYIAWTLLGLCDGTLEPTSAPTPYTGGSNACTYTKMDTSSSSPTPVDFPVMAWSAGTKYEAGDQVRIGAKKFQCKPWPFYIWCRVSAYAPTQSETGLWTNAWTLAGTCPSSSSDN